MLHQTMPFDLHRIRFLKKYLFQIVAVIIAEQVKNGSYFGSLPDDWMKPVVAQTCYKSV